MLFNLKDAVFSTTIISMLIALTGCGSTQTRTDTPQSSDSPMIVSNDAVYAKGATLRVDGLGCPMCAESISILMGNIDAVTKSHVDLSTGIVHVDLDPSIAVTQAELRKAIDDGGFTFRSIAFEK